MKSKRIVYAVSLVFLITINSSTILANLISTSAITAMWGKSRLGDQILLYSGAKLISLKYDIPFLYQKNVYLDQLVLAEKELGWDEDTVKQFDNIEQIVFNTAFSTEKDKKILYQVTRGVALQYLNKYVFSNYDMKEISQSVEFLSVLKSLVKPKKNIQKFIIPSDVISVAVHVRKGSGRDNLVLTTQSYPNKFLPDQFYIDQIKSLSYLFNNKMVYVYLFTDAKEPLALKQKYMNALSDSKNIIFDCSDSSSQDTDSILGDLFSMADFDCLIRSNSSFSKSAQLIGEHKIVICPTKTHWDSQLNDCVVDQFLFLIRDSKWCENVKKIGVK